MDQLFEVDLASGLAHLTEADHAWMRLAYIICRAVFLEVNADYVLADVVEWPLRLQGHLKWVPSIYEDKTDYVTLLVVNHERLGKFFDFSGGVVVLQSVLKTQRLKYVSLLERTVKLNHYVVSLEPLSVIRVDSFQEHL